MNRQRHRLDTCSLLDHSVRNRRKMFWSTSLAAASRSTSGSGRVRLGTIHAGIVHLVTVTVTGGMIATDHRNQQESGHHCVINRAHEQNVLYRLRRYPRQKPPAPYNNRAWCRLEKLPTRSQLSSSTPTGALDPIAPVWLRGAVKPGNVYRPDCNRHHARNEWMQ